MAMPAPEMTPENERKRSVEGAVPRQISVGEAKEVLAGSAGNLLEQRGVEAVGVEAVGVGLRDQHAAFIVTVTDVDAKDRFLSNHPEPLVGRLPLHVDISPIGEASVSMSGRDFDERLLGPRPSAWHRLARVFFGFRTLFAR
jgi:hypothetical protein